MSDTPTPPSNQVAAASTNAAENAAMQSAEAVKLTPEQIAAKIDSLGELNEQQLAVLASGDNKAIAAMLDGGDVGKPATGEEKPKEEAKPEENVPDRISLKAVKDREERLAIIRATSGVRDGKYANMKEGLAAELGIKAEAPAKPAEEPSEEKLPVEEKPKEEAKPYESEAVATIKAELDGMNKALKEAREVFDYDKALEIQDQITDAKIRLARAEDQAAVEGEHHREWENAENAARQRVTEKYAELMTDPEIRFAQYLNAETFVAEQEKDDILNRPDWPEQIADRVFQKYFNGRVAQSAPGANTPPPAPKNTGIRLPGSLSGSGNQTQAITPAQALAEFESLSPEEQEAALNHL